MHKVIDRISENVRVKSAIERTFLAVEANNVFEHFPYSRDIVISLIIKESENLMTQLRLFSNELGDIVIAMKFTYSKAFEDLLGRDPFSSDEIFNEDHVLSIQRLYGQFSQVSNQIFHVSPIYFNSVSRSM